MQLSCTTCGICLFKNQDEVKSGLTDKRVLVLVEISSHMRNGQTYGLKHLSPIDTSACILLTLHHLGKRKDQTNSLSIFASTDKFEEVELSNINPNLNTIETIFQKVSIV